jgi:hypothetical protein
LWEQLVIFNSRADRLRRKHAQSLLTASGLNAAAAAGSAAKRHPPMPETALSAALRRGNFELALLLHDYGAQSNLERAQIVAAVRLKEDAELVSQRLPGGLIST